MGKRLAGKVAIITGATLGLGKAGALLFAREGASVVICDRGRTPENAQKVLKEAKGLSGEIAYKKCAVMKKEDITALVQFTLEQYGRVDVMVNNAIIDNPGVPLRSYLSMCELIKAIAKGRPVPGPHEPLAIEERLGPIERMWSPDLDLGD